MLSAAAALALAGVHLVADRVHAGGDGPRTRWLSFAGGTSVAFVFLHLLPDLQEAQRTVHEEVDGVLAAIEHQTYLAALVGLVVYYGVEHAALQRTRRDDEQRKGGEEPPGFFWGHVALFAFFNMLIGYLLHREIERQEWISFAVLSGALLLHFFSNDFALRDHHPDHYHRYGRWLLAAAVLAGWVVGWWAPLHQVVLALLLGFAAGGIVLNALKEELPGERQGHMGAFVTGAAISATLMLVS